MNHQSASELADTVLFNSINTHLDAIKTNTAETTINAGDIELHVDGLEALQTTTNTHLGNIHSRQDDILTASNAIKLSVASMDTDLAAHKTANNSHLGNIYSRQDDILTASNAIKLSVASMDTDLAAHKTANNSHLGNIYSRQDDILTASNATKLSVASMDTDLAGHKSSNNTNLVNIYNRQDDILTATNAVKTNTQSLEDCVASNKVNVNIASNALDFATESTLQTIAEFNCDTTDTTITSSVLPSGASTSALQRGGLPSALSSDNLKVSLKETITVPVSNGALTELASALNSDKLDVNISSGNISGFATAALQAGGLPSALSSDNLKVSLKESIAVGVTNTTLTNLDNCIDTNELQVDIVASLPAGTNAIGKLSANSGVDIGDVDVTSLPLTFNSGNKDGTCQRVVVATDDVNMSAIKSSLDSLDNAVDGNYLNVNQNIAGTDVDSNSGNKSAATQRVVIADDDTNLSAIKTAVELLDDCIGTDNSTGPAKCMSIGGTNLLGGAIQEIACDGDGHLQVDILSSALPSGAAGAVEQAAIIAKTTLATSSEVKTLLSGVTVNSGTQSTEFDTENYEKVRFFGESTASVGTDIILMGSNVSGGTFYVLGENLRSETIAGVHYVYGADIENLPRYIKILNKHGSNNYVFTKLYFQGSGGRLGV